MNARALVFNPTQLTATAQSTRRSETTLLSPARQLPRPGAARIDLGAGQSRAAGLTAQLPDSGARWGLALPAPRATSLRALQRRAPVLVRAQVPGQDRHGPLDTEQGRWDALVRQLKAGLGSPREVTTPEGETVLAHNPEVAGWLSAAATRPWLQQIRAKLGSALDIQLTDRGFVKAAERVEDGQIDETNYDAIWVRDAVWAHLALAGMPERRHDARRSLLALWDYYATDPQRQRLARLIQSPDLAHDPMNLPHIRFNGASPNLDDVQEYGRPQQWNHKQLDAHGLFLVALAQAVDSGLLTASDLTPTRAEALLALPRFLSAINFSRFEDAGMWEELERNNASSMALVTRGLELWARVARQIPRGGHQSSAAQSQGATVAENNRQAFAAALMDPLSRQSDTLRWYWGDAKNFDHDIARGYEGVRRNLAAGGESPCYDGNNMRHRKADAALLALVYPSPLEQLSDGELRHVMSIVESLVRPAGVIRYENDSYQSANYWFPSRPAGQHGGSHGHSNQQMTGDTSSAQDFARRAQRLLAGSEAEWFFDSWMALAYVSLAERSDDPGQKQSDIDRAVTHLRRSLGQLTPGADPQGRPAPAADGRPVGGWLAPESINTVVVDGERHYVPSPIAPLNWAKATLAAALQRLEPYLPDA